MYLGLKYSLDGVAFLIGMKIGAVKMIFPILVLDLSEDAKKKKGTDQKAASEDIDFSILIGYFIS